MKKIKKIIKKIPFLYEFVFFITKPYRNYINRKVYIGETKLNILQTFPIFEAHGWGLYPIRSKLTIQCINQMMPALAKISWQSPDNINFKNELTSYLEEKEIEDDIKFANLFTKYGSDKASLHNYHALYNRLLKKTNPTKKIFEIGLGTNNLDIVSTMGKDGKPGASLRAFRDYVQSAKIYGADYDNRILFTENRIQTYFVDQTDPLTFKKLSSNIGNEFDLMIDDGLHSPNANLHSLQFFMHHLKIGGYAVIEDINKLTEPIWKVVSHLIEPNFQSAFIETKSAFVFVIKRVS